MSTDHSQYTYCENEDLENSIGKVVRESSISGNGFLLSPIPRNTLDQGEIGQDTKEATDMPNPRELALTEDPVAPKQVGDPQEDLSSSIGDPGDTEPQDKPKTGPNLHHDGVLHSQWNHTEHSSETHRSLTATADPFDSPITVRSSARKRTSTLAAEVDLMEAFSSWENQSMVLHDKEHVESNVSVDTESQDLGKEETEPDIQQKREGQEVMFPFNTSTELNSEESKAQPEERASSLHKDEEMETLEQHDTNNSTASNEHVLREEEFQKAQEELGATSMAFIERLRGAAFRRKMNLARSRDSLANKEREHRKALAEEAALRKIFEIPKEDHRLPLPDEKESKIHSESEPAPTVKPFKARPVPPSSGVSGTGGMVGVPKVAKKMATTPISPMLGARRKQKETNGDPGRIRENVHQEMTFQFRARAIPNTTGTLGQGGQFGVPKIAKRSATVPESPLLGSRRKQQYADSDILAKPIPFRTGALGQGGQSGVPKIDKRPVTVPESPLLGARRKQQYADGDILVKPIPFRTGALGQGGQTGVPKIDKRPATVPESPLLGSRRKQQYGDSDILARPIPFRTGALGQGGQSGVPKIDKRPVTVPESPLLGARRKQQYEDGDMRMLGETKSNQGNMEFKARALPSATKVRGYSGQPGVPKVSKRPTTVPESPLLGHRRKQQPQVARKLLGLTVLRIDKENSTAAVNAISSPPPVTCSTSNGSAGYQPHSSRRAEQRAAFEIQRAANEERRKEQERRERHGLVRRLRRELDVLREEI